MSRDAGGTRQAPGPPRDASEAEMVWRSPAAGCSPLLALGLVACLAIGVGACVRGLWLFAGPLIVPLVLVPLLMVRSVHLLSPGGVTIKLPFGTQSHPWSDFVGFWAEHGKVYLQRPVRPMEVPVSDRVVLNAPTNTEQVIAYLLRYLPQFTGEDDLEHG